MHINQRMRLQLAFQVILLIFLIILDHLPSILEMLGQLPFLLLMLVIFFFFIILPQQRRTKKEKNYMNNLKKGDRVITKSGVHAKVMEVNEKDETFIVETLSGKLKIEKTAVSLDMSSKLNSNTFF